jgi:aspartyl-tRNA(Asn)/glutamyl-tRNA(Gln) amidotransferase subunit B
LEYAEETVMPTAYEPVIGLEVHAHLLTKSKAFCACSATFGAEPNTNVCPVCLGLPGALPVLNERVVAMAMRAGLALGGTIRPRSTFARKNYFYPDLPKGYQISQFDEPLSQGGFLEFDVPEKRDDAGKPETQKDARPTRRARITRVHIEEDAGKLLHDTGDAAIVDLNRAGVPLVEIVGEPDLRSGAEAAEYLRTLRELLLFLGVNDGNLEEGSFRCDANVSIRPVGESKLGTRVELKNINSFRFVQKAIDHEVGRQCAVLQGGGTLTQETRGWDEKSGTTYSMRSKEEANDYRYFPDPDLPPLVVSEAAIEQARRELPELPRVKRERFVEALGLTHAAAAVLTQHPRIAAFFEEAAMLSGDPVRVGNFVQSEVLRDVTTHGLSAKIPVSARQVAELLGLVEKGTISGKQAKDVYVRLASDSTLALSPLAVVTELGMAQVSDEGPILAACQSVIDRNPKQVEALRGGKTSLFGFFVGQVMKETGGSANPKLVNAALKKLLGTS